MFLIPRSEKIPRKLSAKKREINSLESRLIACVSRGRLFLFYFYSFNLSPREEDAYSPRAYTRGHSRDQLRLQLLFPLHGREREREREKKEKSYSGNARGKSSEGGKLKRDRDRFDEESERARVASKPYTRRSKESSVFSATMVTKRTGRSFSQFPPVHTLLLLLVRAYASFNRI